MNTVHSVEAFLKAIEPWHDAYSFHTVTYVAAKKDNKKFLIQGRLFLSIEVNVKEVGKIETAHILANKFSLSDINLSPADFIKKIENGVFPTPEGDILFPAPENQPYNIFYQSHHADGLANQNRLDVLTITGAQNIFEIQQIGINWELKAAHIPYDSLEELMFDYRLGSIRTHTATFEAVANNVIAVDLNQSVDGTRANLAVIMAKNLDQNKASLNYRVFSAGEVIQRISLNGKDLTWSTDGKIRSGKTQINVPKAAAIQCYAIYNGVAQNCGWVFDPKTSQNPRRSAYEAFDRELNTLKEFLFKAGGKDRGRNARDLEAGVAWLLWMLGFNVAHLGGTGKTQEAADLLVTSPSGNFIVVECTTGLLKSENKLPLLVERTQAVKEQLQASSNSHLQTIPVIVTPKSRKEIKADIEQAEKLGILVITGKELEEGINKTLVRPNADQIFNDAMNEIISNLAKHKVQDT